MAYRSVVLEAIDDWDEVLNIQARKLRDPRDAEIDDFRRSVLDEIIHHRGVSFAGWHLEEVSIFITVAFPRRELRRLIGNGDVSKFFDLLHETWRPSFFNWAFLLWKFTGNAHDFFTDLLFLMPQAQRASPAEMGKVFFSEMIRKDIMRHTTLSSIIAAFVSWPLESTYVTVHEKEVASLSQLLTAWDTGILCRSLIRHRCRKHCQCGYDVKEDHCVCMMRYLDGLRRGRRRGVGSGGRPTPRGEDFEGDMQKEYACALLKVVLENHLPGKRDTRLAWGPDERDEFVQSSCEYIFSDEVYVELYQNFHSSRKPTRELREPRALSQKEIHNNKFRSRDKDYDNTFAQHSGCVHPGCKQNVKQHCTNTCCKLHCDNGTRSCRVHRVYLGAEHLPNYDVRPNIIGSRPVEK